MPEKGAQPNVPVLQRRILKVVSALTTPLLPDDYLEMINPLWSTRELRGRVEWQQWWMVHRTIARLAFPGGTPRPKPGPYQGEVVLNPGEAAAAAASASNGAG